MTDSVAPALLAIVRMIQLSEEEYPLVDKVSAQGAHHAVQGRAHPSFYTLEADRVLFKDLEFSRTCMLLHHGVDTLGLCWVSPSSDFQWRGGEPPERAGHVGKPARLPREQAQGLRQHLAQAGQPCDTTGILQVTRWQA
jgi:hypothetical protein